jgi:hypothetical protein
MDDFAGRRCCREGVVGGRLGIGSASSRNNPRRVVEEPFFARDFKLANEPFLGRVRSPGLVGRLALVKGVNGIGGRWLVGIGKGGA